MQTGAVKIVICCGSERNCSPGIQEIDCSDAARIEGGGVAVGIISVVRIQADTDVLREPEINTGFVTLTKSVVEKAVGDRPGVIGINILTVVIAEVEAEITGKVITGV